MGIAEEIRRIVKKREKELEVVKIAKKTEANMKEWVEKQKKESLFDKLMRWLR